jgi:Protein of unknown function (DUF2934)
MKHSPGADSASRTRNKRPVMTAVDPTATSTGEDIPSREARIQVVAYALYESRGCVQGRDLDDWLAAEAAIADEETGSGSTPGRASH